MTNSTGKNTHKKRYAYFCFVAYQRIPSIPFHSGPTKPTVGPAIGATHSVKCAANAKKKSIGREKKKIPKEKKVKTNAHNENRIYIIYILLLHFFFLFILLSVNEKR